MGRSLTGPGESVVQVVSKTARTIWSHPENRGRRLRRCGTWLTWQMRERTTGQPRVVEFHDGLRLLCRPHDQVSSMAMYYGLYDSAEMRFLLAWLRPGDTFLDVGANVAPYSLLSTLVDGVTAVAFEPVALARERAAANIALNGVEASIELVPMAVGDERGTVDVSTDRWARNAVVDGGYAGAVDTVEVTTLDLVAEERSLSGISLVKVDVEGYEPQVLRGASTLLADQRPALILEVNDPAELRALGTEHGYTPVDYEPRTRNLVEVAWPERSGGNIILVADVVAARARVGRPVPSDRVRPKV